MCAFTCIFVRKENFPKITEYIFDRFGIRKTSLLKYVKCGFINIHRSTFSEIVGYADSYKHY